MPEIYSISKDQECHYQTYQNMRGLEGIASVEGGMTCKIEIHLGKG